ncbi:MAG: Gfo/Idh/MocA family oxidoreductase [Spirochaetia bacterium]|jgi:predicted dehydrogenase
MGGFTKIEYDPRGARIGIGVLGYGFMGKVHSNAYVKIPYSFEFPSALPCLRAICGRHGEKAAETARRFGFQGYYTDWKEMIADPEVQIVDNCTPDNEHCSPSIAAAQAGKHVICEKPLAMNVHDAKAMAAAAKKAGVKNMLCHNYRFIPAVRLARDMIARGDLGKIYHFRGRYLQEPGHDPAASAEECWYASGTKSGVLLGIGCHAIDMARFLIGEITAVSGLVRTYNPSRVHRDGRLEQVTADEANLALVEFGGGATGTIESSGVSTGRKNEHAWEINGSKGSIAFDLEDPNYLQVYTDSAPVIIRGFAAVSVTDPSHPLQTLYLPPGHNAGWEYGHVHALHHFIDCVANDKPVSPLGATFEDGVRIQRIMEAIGESSRSGRRIELASYGDTA